MAGSISMSWSVTFFKVLESAASSSVPAALYSIATKKTERAMMIPRRKPTHRLFSRSALSDFFISKTKYTKCALTPLYKPWQASQENPLRRAGSSKDKSNKIFGKSSNFAEKLSQIR